MKKIFIAPVLTVLLLSSCDFSSGDDFDKGELIDYISARAVATDIYNKSINKNALELNVKSEQVYVPVAGGPAYLKTEDYVSVDFSYSYSDSTTTRNVKEDIKVSNKDKFMISDASYFYKFFSDGTTSENDSSYKSDVVVDNGLICVANDRRGDKTKKYYPQIDINGEDMFLFNSNFYRLASDFLHYYYVSIPAACILISAGFDTNSYILDLANDHKITFIRRFYSSGPGNLTAYYYFSSSEYSSVTVNKFERVGYAEENFVSGSKLEYQISWNDYKPYRYTIRSKRDKEEEFSRLRACEAEMSIKLSYDKVSPRSVNLDEYRTIE